MPRMRMPLVVLTIALAAGLPAKSQDAPTRNGFVLEPSSVPSEEILRGGPPRDGIPALDHPPHAPPAGAGWPADQPILGVALGGEARAYPLDLLLWHEVVNDTLGGQPILVSYCPLCGTGVVFDRRIEGTARRFGVSGLLYRSDLLLYDRETESLWSQIAASAITGPARGERLRLVRSRMTRLDDWVRAHPGTRVLTRATGHTRPYGRSPYGDYAFSERLVFPAPLDPRYHPKMPTLGVRRSGGAARAYPGIELVKAGGRVEEAFDGVPIVVGYDPDRQVFTVEAPAGIEVIEGYWFAWMAFHPESSVFVAGAKAAEPAGTAPARPAGGPEPATPGE